MSGWDLLIQGKWFDAALYPYISIITPEIFYTTLLLLILGITYVKTRSLEMVSAMLIITSAVLVPLVRQDVRLYLFMLIAVGLSYALYVLLWRR